MPEPLLVAALLAGVAALTFLVLWRKAAPYAPRCAILEGRLDERDRKAETDGAELRRLAVEESRLGEAVAGLRRQLDEAAEARERFARHATEERGVLLRQLEEARGQILDLNVANERLGRDLKARSEAHEAEVALLKELREDMANRFQALADATLKDHGDRFGQANRERMEALMRPMREQVDAFQRELREAHTGAAKDRERLKSEIEALSRRSEEVSREAVALTNALKGEKQRQGAWGEMILERVLEDSGLVAGREYQMQTSVRTEEGQLRRPDAVVRLPGGKAVVIDAKVSLVAYEAAVNAEDPDERERHLRAHVQAVQAHVDELARRDYAGLVEGAVDYVLMFMPVEGALAAALDVQGDLTSRGMAKGVAIATPTTLMMALRTIQHVWSVERRNANAEEIARRAGLMFDKMAVAVEYVEAIGGHLGRAQQAHADAMGSLARGQGNLLGQFDKLERLGARTRRAMPVGFDGDDEGDAPAIPRSSEAAE